MSSASQDSACSTIYQDGEKKLHNINSLQAEVTGASQTGSLFPLTFKITLAIGIKDALKTQPTLIYVNKSFYLMDELYHKLSIPVI